MTSACNYSICGTPNSHLGRRAMRTHWGREDLGLNRQVYLSVHIVRLRKLAGSSLWALVLSIHWARTTGPSHTTPSRGATCRSNLAHLGSPMSASFFSSPLIGLSCDKRRNLATAPPGIRRFPPSRQLLPLLSAIRTRQLCHAVVSGPVLDCWLRAGTGTLFEPIDEVQCPKHRI